LESRRKERGEGREKNLAGGQLKFAIYWAERRGIEQNCGCFEAPVDAIQVARGMETAAPSLAFKSAALTPPCLRFARQPFAQHIAEPIDRHPRFARKKLFCKILILNGLIKLALQNLDSKTVTLKILQAKDLSSDFLQRRRCARRLGSMAAVERFQCSAEWGNYRQSRGGCKLLDLNDIKK
jgi:hypothetical protein